MRKECDRLWERYRRFAPANFVDQFSRDFDSRFFEMYLGVKLLERYPNLRTALDGPDFVVPGHPSDTFIEATVATRGRGGDAVPDITQRSDDDDSVPNVECLMRVTSCLRNKSQANRAATYALQGPYVVAVNLPYPEAWLCDWPPMAAMATLGAGGVTYELGTGASRVHTKPEIPKRTGSAVPTIGFWTDEYAHISALVVASVNPFSTSYSNPCVELLHNPRCRIPLPHGWLLLGHEYWLDGEKLVRFKHS